MKWGWIQVWVRGPLLWWKPTWRGSNRACSITAETGWRETYSDQKWPQRIPEKELLGLKTLKMARKFWKTQASINQQPGIQMEKIWHEILDRSSLKDWILCKDCCNAMFAQEKKKQFNTNSLTSIQSTCKEYYGLEMVPQGQRRL